MTSVRIDRIDRQIITGTKQLRIKRAGPAAVAVRCLRRNVNRETEASTQTLN